MRRCNSRVRRSQRICIRPRGSVSLCGGQRRPQHGDECFGSSVLSQAPAQGLGFGNRITYADDPFSHSTTEFGFDAFQAAKRRYASDEYKAFIGFEMVKSVLERAFLETHGMPIEKVFLNFDLAVGSYRRAAGSVLPAMTRIAWQINKQEIRKVPRNPPFGLERPDRKFSTTAMQRFVATKKTAEACGWEQASIRFHTTKRNRGTRRRPTLTH